ncbi:hypothetical protein [Paracoccus aminophilus]|uniref:Uncharacterized protein n=1 Tax=Paracoccus aminophilus JCM 7686 TaxID=1367847 RepID=S5YJ39_PARAH|nr:hypothetical protein [Paracoccus aminophilus]AGT11483.1 hypothetical protein JCM7686_pAMI6p153 [Paracoccus aminophilus JCM 7686]
MIGVETGRSRTLWLLAGALSVGLHGAAVATALYQPSLPDFTRPAPPLTDPEISVEALLPVLTLPETAPDPGTDTPPDDPTGGLQTQTLTPLTDTGLTDTALAGAPDAGSAPEVLRPLDLASVASIVSTPPTAPEVARPGTGETLATVAPSPPESAPGPETATASGPTDPRLAALVERVRARLESACLLALPRIDADQLSMKVLAADDREIGDFTRQITEGLAAPVDSRPVLLDSRQCPGLTFLRRSAGYPAYALPIQLEAEDIASGSAARGSIGNGAGSYNTLLLIDDNGVVQDLRRFLTVQGGTVTFDVPMTRSGSARDTSQILIAIATAAPLQSVSQNAGKLAQDFFPALAAELGENPRLGVSSLYVR